jgi:hypothetical protein
LAFDPTGKIYLPQRNKLTGRWKDNSEAGTGITFRNPSKQEENTKKMKLFWTQTVRK